MESPLEHHVDGVGDEEFAAQLGLRLHLLLDSLDEGFPTAEIVEPNHSQVVGEILRLLDQSAHLIPVPQLDYAIAARVLNFLDTDGSLGFA